MRCKTGKKMTKILMLVNWKIEYADRIPEGKQPPDYYVEGKPYWFFRYFEEPVHVDVLDVHSFHWLENFEKNKLRFYVWQALRAIPKLHKYDLILSHGAQSGVVVCLWRRLLKGKAKHVLFDIGAFNSAAESGGALKLMQFASRSLNGVIYHTSNQKEYYKKCFPWLLDKSRFIPFGTDSEYFVRTNENTIQNYMICVGYQKRDWNTLVQAYLLLSQRLHAEGKAVPELRLVGKEDYPGKDTMELPPGAKIAARRFIPLEELIEEIQGSLFGVLPLEDFNYSFGQMTLLQQMALGKAVITAKVLSMVDYVTDGETGLLYEAGNKQDLCDKMYQLYENLQLRERISDHAAMYVQEQYNEQTMAHLIEKYLKSVLEQ